MKGANWEKTLNFVNIVVTMMNISVDGSHAALTVFSKKTLAEVKIPFSPYKTTSSFVEDVYNLPTPEPNWGTYALKGLEKALNQMFTKARKWRKTVPKTLIYITDGESMGADPKFREYKEEFGKRNIRIIGIGVGEDIDPRQIKLVVEANKYYPLEDFDELAKISFVHNISLCDGMFITYFI